MERPSWGGICYELGARRRSVSSIEGVTELFTAVKLPMNPALLAYGDFHESTLPPVDMLEQAVAGSLAKAGVAPGQVDALILATADPGFLSEDRALLAKLLDKAGLYKALPQVLTGQECTCLLSALNDAWNRIATGAARTIVVACYDFVESEQERVQSFGIVSDAAIACVVSIDVELPFGWRRFSLQSDIHGMRGEDDFDSRKRLIDGVSKHVLHAGDVSLSDVDKVFSTNFFTPLSTFNARTMGLKEGQLYTGTTSRIGHCMNADPLINLAAFSEEATGEPIGTLYLLQAYAPGFLATSLIERIHDSTSGASVSCESQLVEETW
jgi:3-oxoacyl-[acyl-carrier-protein] synthase-3